MRKRQREIGGATRVRKIFEISSASIILNFHLALVARTLNASTMPENWV